MSKQVNHMHLFYYLLRSNRNASNVTSMKLIKNEICISYRYTSNKLEILQGNNSAKKKLNDINQEKQQIAYTSNWESNNSIQKEPIEFHQTGTQLHCLKYTYRISPNWNLHDLTM